MTPERVVFYNACNNGDIAVSRELIKVAVDSFRAMGIKEFGYSHSKPPEILLDLDLDYWHPSRLPVEQARVKSELIEGKTLALSTWYAHSPLWGRNGDGFGMTLNTLVALFKEHVTKAGGAFPNAPVERFIPQVDWKYYAIRNVDGNMPIFSRFSKRVLFCNGPAMSGQTNVADYMMNGLLEKLVAMHPDVVFFYTDRKVTEKTREYINAVSTQDVIGPVPYASDLNETAYLGTFCDVIIGRCSGPQSFCFNTDVLFDLSKTMVSFSTDERPARWVYQSEKPLCRSVWSTGTQLDEMYLVVAQTFSEE